MSALIETPAMRNLYEKKIMPVLKNQFGIESNLAVPRLQKIVINIGCGDVARDAKMLEAAQATLATISGQQPVVCRAKKSISNFKLREGDVIGCKVTLRRSRMYEFLERLIHIVAPRIRDFRGMSPKGFDGQGNYTLGLTEQYIFPEINPDKMQHTFGMNISFVTTATNKEQARALMDGFGFPFAKSSKQSA
jgi:large subunit ribosomal protein L5